MTTTKQLLANKKNALKSTGPRSAAGMSIASKNAIKHGLRAQQIVIEGESHEEFDDFRRVLLDDLSPIGQLEVMLADRIIGSFWKLKRSGRMENELYVVLMNSDFPESSGCHERPFEFKLTGTRSDGTRKVCSHSIWSDKGIINKMEDAEPDVSEFSEPLKTPHSLGSVALKDFTSSNILSRFRRYECQIERSLYKALTELNRHQWLRKRNDLIINEDEP